MTSLFGSFEIGRKSLLAQQLALQVTSNNIANVNTPGYTRQRAVLQESLPMHTACGWIGSGVDVTNVESVRDQFLELRLAQTAQSSGRDETVVAYLSQVESFFGGQPGLQEALSRFFNSFSMLATDAESPPLRYSVAAAAQSLAASFQASAQQLSQVRLDANAAIDGTVNQINGLILKIAALNDEIIKAEIDSTTANTLRDQRGEALSQLASLLDIQHYEAEDGTLSVSAAGQTLITSGLAQTLRAQPSGPYGFSEVSIGQANITGAIRGGRLGGLLQVRDELIPRYQADLDSLAESVISQVNSLHQAGTDIQIPPTSPALNLFNPVSGVAGAAQAFSVNPAVAADIRNIAAGQSGAPGDNANALAIANLANQKLLAGGTQTFGDAFAALQSKLGIDTQNVQGQLETEQAIRIQLQNSRDAVSGVSLDEEAVDLIRFQRAYQASAKYISIIDQLTEEVIEKLGT